MDNHPECGAWAARGECANNPNYMMQSCRASCAALGAACCSFSIWRRLRGPAQCSLQRLLKLRRGLAELIEVERATVGLKCRKGMVALAALNGTPFDGSGQFSAEERRGDDGDGAAALSVSFPLHADGDV